MIEPETSLQNTQEIAPPPPLTKVSLAQQMDMRMLSIEQELEFDRAATNTAHLTFIRKTAHIETSINVIMWGIIVIAVLIFALAIMAGVILGRLL
jgi:hypothetical protein